MLDEIRAGKVLNKTANIEAERPSSVRTGAGGGGLLGNLAARLDDLRMDVAGSSESSSEDHGVGVVVRNAAGKTKHFTMRRQPCQSVVVITLSGRE